MITPASFSRQVITTYEKIEIDTAIFDRFAKEDFIEPTLDAFEFLDTAVEQTINNDCRSTAREYALKLVRKWDFVGSRERDHNERRAYLNMASVDDVREVFSGLHKDMMLCTSYIPAVQERVVSAMCPDWQQQS